MNDFNLKPCPFCGGAAELDCSGDGDFSYIFNGYANVRCSKCEARSEVVWIGSVTAEESDVLVQEAIDKWNTRTPQNGYALGQMKGAFITLEEARKRRKVKNK